MVTPQRRVGVEKGGTSMSFWIMASVVALAFILAGVSALFALISLSVRRQEISSLGVHILLWRVLPIGIVGGGLLSTILFLSHHWFIP